MEWAREERGRQCFLARVHQCVRAVKRGGTGCLKWLRLLCSHDKHCPVLHVTSGISTQTCIRSRNVCSGNIRSTPACTYARWIGRVCVCVRSHTQFLSYVRLFFSHITPTSIRKMPARSASRAHTLRLQKSKVHLKE